MKLARIGNAWRFEKECQVCGKIYYAPTWESYSKYCSANCRQTGNARSHKKRLYLDSIRGKGAKTKYIKFRGMHMHRYVAEQKIGRKLKHNEIVHHIDGNSWNNDPENLQVMTQNEHAGIHFKEYHKRKREEKMKSIQQHSKGVV